MAVPKSKPSKSKRNMRRSHDALKGVNVSFDKNGEPVLSHHISLKGNYKGRNIFAKLEKAGAPEAAHKAEAAPKAKAGQKSAAKPKSKSDSSKSK